MNFEKKRLATPLTAQLEVTSLCNHRCIHCYNLDSDIAHRPIVSVSDDTVIACAQKLIDSKLFGVIVTGGEPLLKKELTKRVIVLLLENGLRVNLNSNITLFDDGFIRFLRDYHVNVLTSCPSANPYSYKQLVGADNYSLFKTNLQKLLRSGVGVFVNMVVTKDNLNDIRSTASEMKELGCRFFAATPMALNMDYPRTDLMLSSKDVQKVIYDLLWIKEKLGMNIDILEALPKCVFPSNLLYESHSFINRSCQAGRTVIAVSCNGEVRPCAHNSHSYGNILNEDLKDIWSRMKDWQTEQYIPFECKECTWLSLCHFGCRTSAYGFAKAWDAKDVWCKGALKLALPPKDTTLPLVPTTMFKVNKNFVHRKEYDNAYVIYNVQDDVYFMINKVFLDFISDLKQFDIISYFDIKSRFNILGDNSVFDDTIRYLLQKKILYIFADNK